MTPRGARIGLVILLAGSAVPAVADPGDPAVPFDPGELLAFQGGGPANLHGRAFTAMADGTRKTCNGADVILLPGTAYDAQVVAAERAGSDDLTHVNVAAVAAWRRASCTPQGNFVFVGVPAGKWFVETVIQWTLPGHAEPERRVLLQDLVLKPGDNIVTLTDAAKADAAKAPG